VTLCIFCSAKFHYAQCHYAECRFCYAKSHYAECHYVECRGALILPQQQKGTMYHLVKSYNCFKTLLLGPKVARVFLDSLKFVSKAGAYLDELLTVPSSMSKSRPFLPLLDSPENFNMKNTLAYFTTTSAIKNLITLTTGVNTLKHRS
jgi:hypothetical protein